MDAAGRISKFQVRCPCGKSFENVETYLEHKSLCINHQKGNNVTFVTPNSSPRAATRTARASVPASLSTAVASVACRCSNTLEIHDGLQRHECRRAVQKQQRTTRSNTLNLVQVPGSNSGAGSVIPTRNRSSPPAEATAQKIQCPCGKSFPNEKKLESHLWYSKTHQTGKTRSGYAPKGRTLVSVPPGAPHSPPTSIPPSSSGLSPGTIPLSMFSVASLIYCTCGHAFETQRILDLHKRDSLYHRHRADKSLTQNRQQDNSLVSSFASLKLEPMLSQTGPAEARFTCLCGRTFTNQQGLEAHRAEKGRLSWPDNGGTGEAKFKTARPQYQMDEYLRDISAALARQSDGGE